MGVLKCIRRRRKNQIAGFGLQFHNRHVHRGQRRRAGGIHGIIRPAKIKAVGNPSRGHVSQRSGKGIFGPFRKLRQNLLRHIFKKRGQRRPESITLTKIRQPAAGAHDDRGALPGKRSYAVPCIFQGGRHRFQGKQLQRFDGSQRVGRHSITHGIKRRRIQKPAPF